MITAIRLRNFRSIVDSGWIGLKPLTLLVGKNSVGKSTFLRFMALLKQTLQVSTKGPLLWYGNLVDFGGFNTTVRDSNANLPIVFGFRASVATNQAKILLRSDFGESFSFLGPDYGRKIFISDEAMVDVQISLHAKGSGDCYISKVHLSAFGDHVEFDSTPNGEIREVRVNQKRVPLYPSGRMAPQDGSLIPNIVFDLPNPGKSIESLVHAQDKVISAPLRQRIQGITHGNTSEAKLIDIAQKIRCGEPNQFYQHCLQVIPGAAKRFPRDGGANPPEVISILREYALLARSRQILRSMNQEISGLARSVRYLAPVRSTASRYYRFQELAVNEISPSGENFPMFLHALSEQDKRDFESWLQSVAGFRVRSTREGGHIAIVIQDGKAGAELNLADTGFGYSQVLPLLAQIWSALKSQPSGRKDETGGSFLLLEQPELHLHPNFQAIVANILCNTSSAGSDLQKGAQIRYLVETHSEHIVNRLGALVERKKFPSQGASVVLFEKEGSETDLRIRQSEFDETGTIAGDWPFGFFYPDDDYAH